MKGRIKGNLQQKQRSTSIFFLLWGAFTLVTFLIVVLFGVTQTIALAQTYKRDTMRLLMERGGRVNKAVREVLPEAFGQNYDAYVRFLAQSNDVQVFVLTEDGKVLFPLESNSESIFPAYGEEYDFTKTIVE